MTKVKFAGCVFLMGPTASGKTALAVELAKALNGEVVSVDSALVYRGLDIGTAKPDSNEQQGIPHHLIDICDPAEAYSAARFCQDALSVVNDVRSRGATPILAGGTMLYFNALEHGLSPLPEANSAIRDDINAEAERMGWEGIHQQLQAVDPESAARIHPNDPQRLQRALEVFRVSGETLSVLQKRKGPKLDTPIVKIALQPSSRQWLHDRIAQRFDQMLQSGFIEEVRALHAQGLDPALPSMRAVGYRQALLYLNGEFDASTFRDKGIAATRQLAKRQLTWLRGMSQTLCIPCDTVPLSEQLSISLQGIASHE